MLAPRSQELDPQLAAPARITALGFAALCLLAGGLGALWRGSPERALLGLAGPLLLMAPVALPLLRPLAAARSASALASRIEAACPGAPVIGIDVLPTSLPFYLGRPVGLASPSGRAFPSTYVERHWARFAAALGEGGELGEPGAPLFSTAPWPPLPPRAVLIVRRRDQGAELAATSHGFTALGGDEGRALFGRGCG